MGSVATFRDFSSRSSSSIINHGCEWTIRPSQWALRNSRSRHGWEQVHCSLLKAIVTAQEHSVNEPLRIFTNESVVSVAVSLLVVHHVELGQILGCVADGEGGADASFVPLELHLLQPIRVWKFTKKTVKFLAKLLVNWNFNNVLMEI